MLFAKTSFRRVSSLITDEFTSSDASDFPKCGCKGTNIFRKNLQYRKKVVPLHPHFGKTGAFDDVNRLVIRSERRLKDVYANNI